MEFPIAGNWNLHVYIGETLFNEIIVNVQSVLRKALLSLIMKEVFSWANQIFHAQ